jgi:hypothetical protein
MNMSLFHMTEEEREAILSKKDYAKLVAFGDQMYHGKQALFRGLEKVVASRKDISRIMSALQAVSYLSTEELDQLNWCIRFVGPEVIRIEPDTNERAEHAFWIEFSLWLQHREGWLLSSTIVNRHTATEEVLPGSLRNSTEVQPQEKPMKVEIYKKRLDVLKKNLDEIIATRDGLTPLEIETTHAWRRFNMVMVHARPHKLHELAGNVAFAAYLDPAVWPKMEDMFYDQFGSTWTDQTFDIAGYPYFDHPDGVARVEVQIQQHQPEGGVEWTEDMAISAIVYLTLTAKKDGKTWVADSWHWGSDFDYDNGGPAAATVVDPMLLINMLIDRGPYKGLAAMRNELIKAGMDEDGSGNTGEIVYQTLVTDDGGDFINEEWTVQQSGPKLVTIHPMNHTGVVWNVALKKYAGVYMIDQVVDKGAVLLSDRSADLSADSAVETPAGWGADAIRNAMQHRRQDSQEAEAAFAMEHFPRHASVPDNPFGNPRDLLLRAKSFTATLENFEQGKPFFDEVFRTGNVWLYNAIKSAFMPNTPKELRYELEVNGNWQEHLGTIDATLTFSVYLGQGDVLLYNIDGPVQL